MVVPLILGLAGVAGTGWALDQFGVLDVEDAGEEIGEAVGKVAAGAVRAVPEIIEELGPAVVDGLAGSIAATRNALRGREVHAFAALTVVVLSMATYWALRSTLNPPVISVAS